MNFAVTFSYIFYYRRLEDSWLGPWKYLLLGHLYDNNHLSSLERKLMDELRLKYKVTVSNDLLRVILVGAMYASEIREHGLQLILNKGCFIGGSCKDLSNSSSKVRSLSMDVFQMVLEEEYAAEDIEQLTKKPVILVLDSEIQVLLFYLSSSPVSFLIPFYCLFILWSIVENENRY